MYRRYMVFEWTTYDNVEPFQCVADSFDKLEDAIALAESLKDADGPVYGDSCVFDRIKGKRI